MYELQNNENPICATCRHCCESFGCEISPDDVIRWKGELTEKAIDELLSTGYISLDWWDGDPRPADSIPENGHRRLSTYYLHMRNVGDSVVVGSLGGVCMAYSRETGCKLTWEQRPLGGKSLVPNPNNPGGGCRAIWSKKEACLDWFPYQAILERLFDKYYFDEIKEAENHAQNDS